MFPNNYLLKCIYWEHIDCNSVPKYIDNTSILDEIEKLNSIKDLKIIFANIHMTLEQM